MTEEQQAAHREYQREWARKNRIKHPERQKANSANYRERHPEKVKTVQAKWRAANPRTEEQKRKNVEHARASYSRKRSSDVGLEEHRKYRREYMRNRGKDINFNLTRVHGKEAVQHFAQQVKSQNGGCAICGTVPESGRLHQDHDHVRGHLRGGLCGCCNRGLGLFRENPEVLKKAIEYLQAWVASKAA